MIKISILKRQDCRFTGTFCHEESDGRKRERKVREWGRERKEDGSEIGERGKESVSERKEERQVGESGKRGEK